jgi:hypothetical protein
MHVGAEEASQCLQCGASWKLGNHRFHPAENRGLRWRNKSAESAVAPLSLSLSSGCSSFDADLLQNLLAH